jgi:hypothetical protein
MATPYRVVPVRRTHFGLVALFIVCLIAALGFYRGWFTLTEHRETTSNKVDVSLRVDPDKMKNDVKSATDTTKQKAAELGGKMKQEAREIKGRTTDRN